MSVVDHHLKIFVGYLYCCNIVEMSVVDHHLKKFVGSGYICRTHFQSGPPVPTWTECESLAFGLLYCPPWPKDVVWTGQN